MDKAEILDTLAQVIASRKGGDARLSYVAKLFEQGTKKIAQKVGEEGVETALAAVAGDREEVVSESADLVFHLMVLWSQMGITPEEVLQELTRREGVSGIEEKNSRKD